MARQNGAVQRTQFYTTRDIADIMGCGYTKAREQMRDFERKGLTVTFGSQLYIRCLYFDNFLAEQDGYDRVVKHQNLTVVKGGKDK